MSKTLDRHNSEKTDTAGNFVVVGRIGSAFGVRGWLKIQSFTEPKSNLLNYSPWYTEIKSVWTPIAIDDIKEQGQSIIAKFSSVATREEAQLLTNHYIAVQRTQLPKLRKEEYYWSDLEGLTVVNTKNIELGRIDHLFNTGSNDVMVIQGTKEHLLPYLRGQVVLNIDIAAKTMLVDWDEDF